MNKTMTKLLSTAVFVTCAGGSLHKVEAQTPADDKQFITVAGQSDLAEIKQSQLALEKSKNKDVRAFANKMVRDHQMLTAKMKPFATKYDVPPATLLSTEQETQYSALKGLSGAEFNKTYIGYMVKDHHKALDLFNAEVSATSDSNLKTTVSAGQTVVAAHTQMADALAQKMAVTVAANVMGSRAGLHSESSAD